MRSVNLREAVYQELRERRDKWVHSMTLLAEEVMPKVADCL